MYHKSHKIILDHDNNEQFFAFSKVYCLLCFLKGIAISTTYSHSYYHSYISLLGILFWMYIGPFTMGANQYDNNDFQILFEGLGNSKNYLVTTTSVTVIRT